MSAPSNRFSELPGLSTWDADMLNDAYEAISATGNWDNMKNFSGESFMFSKEPWITNIMMAMHHRNLHSGASFGAMMRSMEFIAKNGWDIYVSEYKKNSSG